MPTVSIHLPDELAEPLHLLSIRPWNGTSRPLSRSATIRRAIEESCAIHEQTVGTDDELAREIHELDGLIFSAHQRRARLVTAMRVRDRHHENQTRVTDPQPQETPK